jgi:tetratricopeptide (TPR) repeat protein
MLKPYRVASLLLLLGLNACGASHPTRSEEHPTAVTAKNAPDAAIAIQQLADAIKLVTEKNWPRALAALQAIVDTKTFTSLSSDDQYKALSTASGVAIYHGARKRGYEYLGRVLAMPQAGYGDWSERLREVDGTGDDAESVRTLTLLMQRWPDRATQMDPHYVDKIAREANGLRSDAALPLLQVLYDVHWKLKWDIEPSETWRDLTLRLIEKGRLADAISVSAHVTDVYVLIAMRSDRRFDVVVAASPAQFDIGAAADREFQAFQAAAERAPQSLELKSRVILSLLNQQHYEAALAASDSILSDIRSTNYPNKLYEDYDEERSSFMNLRALALARVGRWDEAIAQLTAASLLDEQHQGNVSQLIDLGSLYCELGRPKDALAAIDRIVARTSPFGAMQLEEVRLEAAEQMGDTKQVGRSLEYLRSHRADAPTTYQDALIAVNQLDWAANLVIAQLLDKENRQSAILSVQAFAQFPAAPRDLELAARRRTVIARPDVQAAIRKVGRVAAYQLEEP